MSAAVAASAVEQLGAWLAVPAVPALLALGLVLVLVLVLVAAAAAPVSAAVAAAVICSLQRPSLAHFWALQVAPLLRTP